MLQDYGQTQTQPPGSVVMRHERVEAQANTSLQPTRIQISIWAGLMLLALAVSLLRFDSFQLGAQYEDASYVLLARSLVESDRYGLLNFEKVPAARMPFAYPLMLAPWVLLSSNSQVYPKALSLVATLLTAAMLFWGWPRLTKKLSYRWALAIVALYLFSPFVIEHTRMVMPEAVLTCLCLAAILMTERATRRPPGLAWLAGMSLLLTLLIFMHPAGLVLSLCVVAYLVHQRGSDFLKELIILLAGAALIVILVMAFTSLDASRLLPRRYLDSTGVSLINTPGSLFNVASHLGSDFHQTILPFGKRTGIRIADFLGMPMLLTLVGLATAALVLIGFIRLVHEERITFFIFFAATYLVVRMIWMWGDPAQIYPIQPQLNLGFLLGIEWVASRLLSRFRLVQPEKKVRAVLMTAYVGLLAASLFESLTLPNSRHFTGDLSARTRWIQSNTEAEAVVLSELPVVDYLYGGRTTAAFPVWVNNPEDFVLFLKATQVDYILIANRMQWVENRVPKYSPATARMLNWSEQLASRNLLTLVHSADEALVQVFRVDIPPAAAQSGSTNP